jgi:hypothetical protein
MITVPPKGDNEKRVNAYFTPLKVEAQASPDMTVKIHPGSYWSALGTHIEFIGGNTPTLTAPASDAKWVVIALNDNGLLEVLNGVSGTNPDLPTIPETSLPLAGIFVGDTTLEITNDMVFDIRPQWTIRPENIPNLAGELSSRPTTTDMNAALALKADMTGTDSPLFTLNQDHVGVTSTDAEIIVNRGAEPDVSIRWNETAEQWEFSNDGSVWGPIGMSSGVFYTKTDLDTGALDTRYYEKSLLDGGVLDSRYFTETESTALFAPIIHTHVAADITDLATVVATTSPVQSVAGKTGIVTLVEADITDLDKYPTVLGAVSGNLVEFGAGVLTDSGSAVSDFATVAHTHIAADVTDFTTAANALIGAAVLNDLFDVVSAGPGDGHVLAYNTGAGWYVNRFLNTEDLDDVDNTGAAVGEVLIHNGVKFINRLPVLADISDFTTGDYVLVNGTVSQTISGAKTFSDLLTTSAGLVVGGATTDINTPVVRMTSNELIMNSGQPDDDAGITIERAGIDAKVFWDDTGSQWMAGPNTSGLFQPIVLGAHTHVAAEVIDFAPAVTAQLGSNNLDTLQDVTYPTSPAANEFLKWTGGMWNNVIPVSTDISDFGTATTTELNVNDLNQLQDVEYITALVDRHALIWDGITDNRWENRLLVKLDVSDFNEADYVHVTGNETIAGDKTFSNDMTVNGNLIVNGTTTTVASTNVAIADNTFTLNKDETGAGVTLGTAGLEIERGTEPNVMIYWDEATDTWRAHHGSGVLTVSDLSFDGHQHVLTDITDITVNALAVNQLTGISTVVTVQTQINDKISRTGDTMDASTNLAFSTGGEVTGLPAIPSGVTSATSKSYVDTQDTAVSLILSTHANDNTVHLTTDQNTFLDALNLPTLTGAEVNFMVGVTSSVQTQINNKLNRGGDTMDASANLAFSLGGEVTGLPAVPSSATAASSKQYVDDTVSTHASDVTIHVTSDQNTYLDTLNLPSLTGATTNFLIGVTSGIQGQLDAKAALAVPAATGNIASLTVLGDLADSGLTLNDAGTSITEMWSADKLITEFATKPDKIVPAVVGSFAGLDVVGNLTDSGSVAADFATVGHTHVSVDITDFDTASDARIALASVGDLTDVTDASSAGDLLRKTVTGWENISPSLIPELVNISTNQLIGGDKTFSGANIVIQNDLTINGTVSTINAVDLNVTDKNITLNDGYTGIPAGATGAGLRVIRGEIASIPQSEATLIWDDALSQWKGGIDGAEIIFAHAGITVAQPDYELLVGTGLGFPTYVSVITVPAPIGTKRAVQVFVNGIKQIEGPAKGYTIGSFGPITITFTTGNEPLVGDDVEIYGFGYIS